MKTCTGCGETKELQEFSKDKRARGGRRYLCKACAKQYREDNRDAISERAKQYREDNRDAILERNKRYRDNNPDYMKRYYRDNRDAISEYQKKYQKMYKGENLEKARAWSQLRRSRKYNPDAPFERFLDVDVFERDDWVCQLCDEEVDASLRWPDPMSPSLDHVVPVSHEDYVDHGHTTANTRLAHLRCNVSRGNRDA